MTDSQFSTLIGALATVLTSLGFLVRWSVNRITKSIDDSTAGQKEAAREVAIAQREAAKEIALAQAKANEALLAQSVEFAKLQVQVGEVHDFIREYTPITPIELPRHQTHPQPLPSVESERHQRVLETPPIPGGAYRFRKQRP